MWGSDEQLARRTLAGRPEAFDELVRRYQHRVYGLCRKMLGDPDAAADAAQETFVRAFAKLDLFDPERNFRAWLLTIATNACINLSTRRPRAEASLESEGYDGEALDVPDAAPGPGDEVESQELRQRVEEAVRSLPVTYREVAILRHVAGLRYEEIAEATGLPLGTVKTHLFRAKRHLREALADWMETE